MAGGACVAYNANAKDSSGSFFYQRAGLWMDAERTMPFDDFTVVFDASGLPTGAVANTISAVYGEGNCLFCFWHDKTQAPDITDDGGTSLPNPPDFTETFFTGQETVSAAYFGAVGDADYKTPEVASTDDTDALQAAIDYCLNLGTVARPYTLIIPKGTYRITRPLIIAKKFMNAYTYASIRIVGEKRNLNDSQADAVIYAQMTDRPGVVIQGGYGVVLKDIAVIGTNQWDITLTHVIQGYNQVRSLAYVSLLDDGFYNYDWTGYPWGGLNPPPLTGKHRDHVRSPHAAVVIDPFIDPNQGYADRYPGLEHEYLGGVGSSAILLEGCSLGRHIVGLAVSPAGLSKNAEAIVVRDCYFHATKIAISLAQSQTRGVNLENISVYACQTAVDNRTYGLDNPGTAPNIRGLLLSVARNLFNLELSTQSYAFEHIYAEGLLSLGFVGVESNSTQNVASFTGCAFNFFTTRPMVDSHLVTFAGVRFESCGFESASDGAPTYVDAPPLMITNHGPVTFHNCSLRMGLRGLPKGEEARWINSPVNWGFHDPAAVTVDHVVHADNLAGTALGGEETRSYMRQQYSTTAVGPADPKGLVRQHVPPRATIGPLKAYSGSTHLRAVSGSVLEIPIPSVLVQKGNGPDEIRFTSLPGRLQTGDVVNSDIGTWPVTIPPRAQITLSTFGGVPPLNPQAGAVGVPGAQNTAPIGVIAAILSGVCYVKHVPKSFMAKVPAGGATFQLRVRRFGRYHTATTGDIVLGSTIIRNVQVEGGAAPNTVWVVGDRLNAGPGGFASGSYITDISYSGTWTFTMSTLALGNATAVRLYDADVYRFAGLGE